MTLQPAAAYTGCSCPFCPSFRKCHLCWAKLESLNDAWYGGGRLKFNPRMREMNSYSQSPRTWSQIPLTISCCAPFKASRQSIYKCQTLPRVNVMLTLRIWRSRHGTSQTHVRSVLDTEISHENPVDDKHRRLVHNHQSVRLGVQTHCENQK